MNEVSNETRFLHVVEMGLGAWQWGDRTVWGYQPGKSNKGIRKRRSIFVKQGHSFHRYCRTLRNGLSEQYLGNS